MQKLGSFILIIFFAVSASSCYKKGLSGHGNVVSETRSVGTFAKLELNGSTRVTVVEDDEYRVIISGYANLVPVFDTRVKGDRLILEYKPGYWNIRNDNITVEVHTPYLDKVSVNGSGDVTVNSGFSLDHFETDINGSGNVKVTGNQYKTMKVDINGSGDFDAENSNTGTADVRISGSGNAYVNVTDYLKVRISGSGDVYYRGTPTVDSDISGSGSVKRRG